MGLLGSTVQLRIDSLVYQGDGLGRYQGKAVFVPFSAPGDLLLCKVIEEKRRFARGRIERVVVPSSCRVSPRCSLFGSCGGCQWQHLDYGSQVEAKGEIFSSILQRYASVPPEVVGEAVPSPELWGYRYRCRLRSQGGAKGGRLGFLGRRSHQVVDVERCPVLAEELNRLLEVVRSRLRGVFYLLSDLLLEAGDRGAPRVLLKGSSLSSKGEGRRLWEDATAKMVELAQAEGFSLFLSRGSGMEPLHLEGGVDVNPLGDSDLLLELPPFGFFQGNLSQNRRLNRLILQLVDTWLETPSTARVLDLFCGMGNLSVPLATVCGEVIGVEASPSAVEAAWRNARRNGLTNLRFLRESCENFLRFAEPGEFQLVVLDPPRTGAKREIPLLAELRPSVVIYVSCDPMTLARDLRELVAVGYEVVSSVPLDMFPHTFHIESVTVLTLEA